MSSIQKLIDILHGSCLSLEEGMDSLEWENELTPGEEEIIDDQIARCVSCSWWYENWEVDEDGYCEECSKYEYEGE